MVPFPHRHLLTWHGILAPARTWRSDVVPIPYRRESNHFPPGASARLPGQSGDSWTELLKRVFEVDVLLREQTAA